jgi:hypothetical protein
MSIIVAPTNGSDPRITFETTRRWRMPCTMQTLSRMGGVMRTALIRMVSDDA